LKKLLALVCVVIFVDSLGYGVVVPVMPVYAPGNIAAALPFGLYAYSTTCTSLFLSRFLDGDLLRLRTCVRSVTLLVCAEAFRVCIA
jgi:hypothetical protein